ncbi:uncharacterized protein LY89DRAFT_661557 [Mollisia scopiformis]|uniref:Uncharacterized protein n=1 Tax=Mollisia scopiformis TaxID=149040 RepID=A0A132B5G0_MOLSC|nr:uncharacterized protein LY89DRAFT_661557 [Mollisia scopiformis]KUJ06907.1 hypothetical protein LY89DRAFT_661557 [Mollisia scopiformis]
MSEAIPIILCGKSPQIATGVKNSLMPEYDVIHIILTPSAGITEIPSILSGSDLDSNDNIGSQNYSKPAQAVVTGAGYDEEAVEKMRKACSAKGGSRVPWLRPDTSIPTPPLGPKYGEAMVRRVKGCLRELEEEGRMEGDGVYFY